jgi:tetratricopeptide (TPR) repeat protein
MALFHQYPKTPPLYVRSEPKTLAVSSKTLLQVIDSNGDKAVTEAEKVAFISDVMSTFGQGIAQTTQNTIATVIEDGFDAPEVDVELNERVGLGVLYIAAMKEGYDAIELGDLVQAAMKFQDALAYVPQAWGPLQGLARVEIFSGNYPMGLGYIDRALGFDTLKPEERCQLLITKSSALIKQKKYEEAIAVCDEILGIDSTNQPALDNKATATKALNRPAITT